MFEVSVDAALPLPVTLELAAFLVKQGACIVSSVIGRKTKLACTTTTRMQERALDFVQEFGISIYVVVSVLTSNGLSLGECMLAATGTNPNVRNDDAAFLRREIMQRHQYADSTMSSTPLEIEETIYNMAVWLRSHQVVIGMEEYLVAVGSHDDQTSSSVDLNDSNASSDSWNAAVESSEQQPQHPEEALYKELLQDLTGNVSTAALCWRYEIDPLQLHRFRSWGVLNKKLRVVTRVPSPTDDWNTRISKEP